MEEAYLLAEDAIHLWLAPLDGHGTLNALWTTMLSAEESQRASSFFFERHRDRFVAAHAVLRILLGRYLNQAPETICFVHGHNGKPEVSGIPIHFSLSHSEGFALFAFSAAAPLGADLEAVREMPDALMIATRFFSRTEAATLASLSPDRLLTAFFLCWTRKEAMIKALGHGLAYPLDSFSVSIDERARLLTSDRLPDVADWKLFHLEPLHGFVAAVATRQLRVRLISRDFMLPS